MTVRVTQWLPQQWRGALAARWDLARLPLLGRLSPTLRWALLGSTAVTLGVLVLPDPDPPVPSTDMPLQPQAQPASAVSTGGSVAPLGATWRAYVERQPPEFAEAERDPFVAERPAPAPAPAVVSTVAAPPPPPAPPPATPQFRVVGWLSVSGEGRQVLLTNGQTEIVAKPGLALPDGFIVQSIDAQRLVLRDPATQADYALSLPASPVESR